MLGRACGKERGEAADEGIAGAGSIDGIDAIGRDVFDRLVAGGERAVRSERDDHAGYAGIQQVDGASAGFVQVVNRQAGESFGFGFVGNNVIGIGELGDVQPLPRRGIENGANAVAVGEPEGVVDGLKRDFELEDDAVGGTQQIGGGLDIGRQERIVGAFDDEDPVLAGGVDKDGGDATGNARSDQDVSGIDTAGGEVLDGGGPKQVVAYARHHGNARTTEARGDSLVGAFAAETELEFPSEDGLTGPRKLVREGGEIHVGAADDYDMGLAIHSGYHNSMQPDPTTRFTTRVDAYERYRPSYPPQVLELARRDCGVTAESRVADIGCGTGLVARMFLDAGCEVFGVEPNTGMREAGERALGGYARFHSVAGRAEATTLQDAAFHMVTAGQAFHWFEAEAARTEFRRILKPGGWVMLVWNERRNATRFMKDYEKAIEHYAPEQPRVNRQRIADFFGNAKWSAAQFSNGQRLDRDGLRGRLASSSYAPQPGTQEFDQLMQAMDELFRKHQHDGLVTIEYETDVFYGAWA